MPDPASRPGRSRNPGGPKGLTRVRAPGGAQDDPDLVEALRSNLAEMTRRTNERNDYINSVFSSIDEGILAVDPSGRIVLYNPRAEELLGIGPRVFFDPPWGTGDPPSRPDRAPALSRVEEACARVNQTRVPERIELETDEGRHLEARVYPMTSKYRRTIPGNPAAGDGRPETDRLGSLALVKDITEMRRLESMRKDFVATVSHEFRTPLTLISGFVEMFKSREDLDPADRSRAFEIMEIETERLKRLISELLTLAEMENALPRQRIEEIDPAGALRDIGRSLGEIAERKGQRLELDVDPGGARLLGNEGWFHRAVYNLVENAIKFSPPGTRVRLSARRTGEGGVGTLLLRVEDEGPGIPREELGRIFERFYRVEKSRGSGGGGSGLGLALVQDIAAIFGGTVRVESEVGKGSAFTLELPLGSPGPAGSTTGPEGLGNGAGEEP